MAYGYVECLSKIGFCSLRLRFRGDAGKQLKIVFRATIDQKEPPGNADPDFQS